MTSQEKDAICQLWVEIFGTQEGAGYNCPQGAYDFAEVVMAYERDQCVKLCEEIGNGGIGDIGDDATELCASAIKARGEK